jgi:uncharacterized protein involved in outer membrane biogenesis
MGVRKVWIGAGAVAGAAALLAAVPYFIDWSWFTPRMIAAVEASTGYEVEVKGDLRFALLPRPSLVVDQVAITGFGAERQPLITAEQLSAAVAFWPLLSQQVEVDYIALEAPVVRLVSYADGSNNWSRGDAAAEPSSAGLKIADFRIANGTLIKRAATGSVLRFDDIDARLTVPSLDGPYGVDGTLVWNKLPVALKADYAPGGAVRVDAAIEDAGTVRFAGRLPEVAPDAPQAIVGTLAVSAPNLDAFLAKFSDDPSRGEPAPAMAAPFELAAHVSGTTDAVRLAGLSGTVGGSKLGGSVAARFGEITSLDGRLVLGALDALRWMSEDDGDGGDPFTFPKGYAADLLVSINRLSYGRAPLGAVNAPVKLANGVMTVGRTPFTLPGGGRGLFQGVVDTPAKVGLRVRGTFTAEMPRPSATLAAFEIGAPAGLPPLSIAGPLTMVGDVVTLTDVRGRFDASPYVASARYPLDAGQPIDVTLVADRINADRLRGDSTHTANDDEPSPIVRFDIAAKQLLSNGTAFAGVRGRGVYDGTKVTIASASAQDAFGFAVRGTGTVDDLAGDMDTDLELSLAGADARGAVAVRGPVSRMTVNGTVNYAGAAVGVDGWVKTEPSLSYQIDVDAKAAEAARVLGQPQPIGPLALTLRASGAGDRATLGNIAGRVGPMQLSGSAVVNTAGARPFVTAALKANEVPLDKLWGRSSTGAAAAAANPGARWSKEPIDFAFLDSLAGKLTFTAGRLTYGGYVLDSPSLIVTANGRQLTLNGFEGDLFGGKLAASGALNAAGVPAGTLKLSLAGVPMEPLLQASMASVPATGTLAMNGSFAVRGRSQHEMIDSLTGPVRIAAENGVINKVDLDRLNQQLGDLRTVNSFLQFAGVALKGGQTPYKSLAIELQGRGGRFDIERVVTDMVGGSATATGAIDLAAWTADVDALLTLGSYADAPSIPGTIKGSLSEPTVAYNLNPMKLWFGKRLALAGLNAAVKGEGVGLGDLLGIKRPATSGITPGAPAAGGPAGTALPGEAAPVAEAAPPAPRKSVEEELGDVVRQGLGSLFKKKKPAAPPAEEPVPEAQPPS